MKNYKYLFFDFDGTLCDTYEGVCEILDLTFAHFGVEVDKTTYSRYIGPPLSDTFSKLLGKEKTAEAVKFFQENYCEKKAIFKTKLYDGIAPTIEKLKEMGYFIGVATCKKHEEAEMLLKYFGIEKNIAFVSGLCYNIRETKRAVLQYAIDKLGLDVNECLMIGDTIFDAEGAESVGMDCLMCLWGFGDYKNMSCSSIVANIEKPSQIIDFVNKK
ncbi:MAG: HAD-IA family hydrolase [Clostridia bacterium]